MRAPPTAPGGISAGDDGYGEVETVSFSLSAKIELAKLFPAKRCCQLAELSALVQTVGTIRISGKHRLALHLNTENAATARKIYRLLKEAFGVRAEIIIRRRRRLRKSNVYLIRVIETEAVSEIFRQLGLTAFVAPDPGADPPSVRKECCRRAYLRGAFLGCGSVNTPSKTYHLEMVTKDENHAGVLCRLLNYYGLNAKINCRKRDFVVYLKDGDAISNLLGLMGAHTAVLEFENVRVVKEMRNNVNRLVNCETANLRKTVDASLQQQEMIHRIIATIGLGSLPDNLQEIAELRLRRPEASLKELGEMLMPPVGKSGVRHRLDRLREIAEKLPER